MISESFAPAKINLYLHVTAPRADGLHPLESLVVFADVGDVVSATAADDLTLAVTGPFAGALANEADNLVVRAARGLADFAGIVPRAAITLEKHLPVASGMGGGSSDAAATLRVLNVLWRVNASAEDLQKIARTLGADVPVCVRAGTQTMRGIGELLADAVFPEAHAVLVNPLSATPTGRVFRAFDEEHLFSALDDPGAPPHDLREAIAWLEAQSNDLESAACRVAPVVSEVLSVLRAAGSAFVRMSGSGATCFALVESAVAASALAKTVAGTRPDWWVRPARLGAVDAGVVER